MALDDGADHLTPLDPVALSNRGDHRLEARDHTVAVPEGEHRPVDDDPREMHHARRGSVEHSRWCGDVDAAMPGGVRGRGSQIGAQDRAGRVDGPAPVTRGLAGHERVK